MTSLIRKFNKIVLLIYLPALLVADPGPLKTSDVKRTMEEIFTYHVEHKSLDPLVVQRSFKIFIEQFDPDRVYLLNSEVKPYLELSPNRVEQIIAEYNRGNFSSYVALSELFDNAISRSRRLRAETEAEFVSMQGLPADKNYPRAYVNYASNEAELKRRAKEQLIRYANRAGRQQEITHWNTPLKEKAFAFYEGKLRHREAQYISEGSKINEHYLTQHILKAMVRSLDAHSLYFSPDEAISLRTSLQKEFHGVGVVLQETFNGVIVTDLVLGGPAEKHGNVQKGDLIVAIDDHSIEGLFYEEALKEMQGPVGTSVKLTLKRDSQLVNVSLKRQKITMDQERLSYTVEPFANGYIAKITLPGFYDNGKGLTAENDLKKAMQEIEAMGPVYGMVLDLRENSGGFLTQAVKIAGYFVPRGVIVISKYADGEVRYFRDLDGRSFYDGPVVVLTSKLSASASEIVAQALQDYGRAPIVGDTRSFGKGTMQYQTITDERASRYYTVTVGRFYTVSGRSNQLEGVKSDIVVPSMYAPYNIGERFLEYPVSNSNLGFSLFDSQIAQEQKANGFKQNSPVPYLIKETRWNKMMPTLKANSAKRLASDPNFQAFLKMSDPEYKPVKSEEGGLSFGEEDLQMTESVNIIKDMIWLQGHS
ncbi:MAG: S41 family peptidase [Candidatus Algichlamydia australiensis]|nr:S41 family peptidase [Chlamydiales bacterium]